MLIIYPRQQSRDLASRRRRRHIAVTLVRFGTSRNEVRAARKVASARTKESYARKNKLEAKGRL